MSNITTSINKPRKCQIPNYEMVADISELFIPCKENTRLDDETLLNPAPIFYENPRVTRKEEKNWHLKLTVPEPFNMTMREELKLFDQRTKPCKRIQNEVEMKKQEEEAECCKVFRANPVPWTTFFPLYNDMIKKEEIRRHLRKEQSREMTLALQKPFNFYYREEVKKFFRSESMPNLKNVSNEGEKKEKQVKPMKKCQSATVKRPKTKNFQENNLQNLKLKWSRDWNWFLKWSLNQNKNVAPKRSLDPPDFKTIHARLKKKESEKLPIRLTTTCEPFNFHDSVPSKCVDKVKLDIKKDEFKLKETRWPFMAPRTPFQSLSSDVKNQSTAPPRLNLAAKLRAETNNKQIAVKNEQDKRNEIWKNILKTCLNDKIAAESTFDTCEERLKRKRATAKGQWLEYQTQLDEILKRVATRPLLMEQQSTMAARKRAERIFLEKLEANGLTEEFILNKSGAVRSRTATTSSSSSKPSLPRSRSASSSEKNSTDTKNSQRTNDTYSLHH